MSGFAASSSTSSSISTAFGYKTPLELFEIAKQTNRPVRICAPMVRYSRLGFRTLVRKYNCDLAYTPMIIAESFILSKQGRDLDFSTNEFDHPVVVQFAANNPNMLATAAEIVAPFVDGIDINCGCPQTWAMKDGYGSALLTKPQLICDMVKAVKERVNTPISIKIRLSKDLRETVELAQRAEKAGISWITVHGRTPTMKSEPVILEGIKLVKENVNIPVVANGDIFSVADMERVHKYTGVDGVMAARGLVENPALFAGYSVTPKECLQEWVRIALSMNMPAGTFQKHIVGMDGNKLTKAQRHEISCSNSYEALLPMMENYLGLDVSPPSAEEIAKYPEILINRPDEENKKGRRRAILMGLPLDSPLPTDEELIVKELESVQLE